MLLWCAYLFLRLMFLFCWLAWCAHFFLVLLARLYCYHRVFIEGLEEKNAVLYSLVELGPGRLASPRPPSLMSRMLTD